ncbi:hypothetical protein HHL22_20630 [Hymenobacter sp. RP-2-7]|uniref:Uncharacterized protein n=1 Tax=Hymenobacter polaris TaxID=2682546 RepID=A0A7Y0AHY9_9BACT|nr:hypothetical protein [Hymenobacter polaris]NML67614.1 hypothetical protein [Hymenobacter polaris]
MAKTQLAPAPEAAAPDMVKLQCKSLNIDSQDFTPAHAKRLLAFQQAKGDDSWQPVTEAPKTND